MPRRAALVAVLSLLLPVLSFAAARKRGDIPSSTNGINPASECPLVNGSQATPFLARFDGHSVSGCEDVDSNPLPETYANRAEVVADNSNFKITVTPIGWAFSFTILEIRFTAKSTNTLGNPTLRTMVFKGNQQFSFIPCNEPSPDVFNSSTLAHGDQFYTTASNSLLGPHVPACMNTPVLAIPVVDGVDRTQYDGDNEIYQQEPDSIYDNVNNVTIVDFTTLAPANGSDAVAYLAISGTPAEIVSDMNVLNELVGQSDLTANGLDYSSTGVHYVVVDKNGNRYEGGSVSLSFPNCTIQGSGCQAPANDSVNSPTNITTVTFQDNIDVSNATQDANDPVSTCYDGSDGSTAFSNGGQFKGNRTVWYELNAQNAGAISILTAGSRYDTRIDVFSGKPASSSSNIACDDDYNPVASCGINCQNPPKGVQAEIGSLSLPAKGTYYIMVSETPKPTGSVVEANGDLTPVSGPPYTTGTIPLAANAILNLSVTATGLSGDKSALSFAAQHVSTTSSALSVTVSAANGSVGSIAPQATGDFAVSSNGCSGMTLSGSSTCTVQVTFKPTADGSRSGTLSIGSNAVVGPLTVSLSGSGYIPQATFNSKTLTFSSQAPKTTSAVQKVTITNGGDGPLTIGSFTSSAALAPFAYTTTCGSSVAVNSHCEFDFTFTPTTAGAASASFTINDDAPSGGSSQTVMLSGTGADVSLGPSLSPFANTIVHAYSVPQTVTLQNFKATSLSVSAVQVSGSFNITSSTCGTAPFTLAASASCMFSIQFTPSATGAATGALTLTDNATTGNGTQSISLSGTGIDVTIAPARPGRTSRTSASPAAPLANIRFGLPLQPLEATAPVEAQTSAVFDSRMRVPARLPILTSPVVVPEEVSKVTKPQAKPVVAAPSAGHRSKIVVIEKSK